MAFKGIIQKIHDYGTLVMFKHTIFSLSFGLVSLLLATEGQLLFFKFFLILVALLSARTGANAINRVIDAPIDAKNPRTANRQLPAEEMSKAEALVFSLACFLVLGVAAYYINPLCLMLLPGALFMMWLYSYTKRFTWLCHMVLGLTCALAPLGAWLAVTGDFGGLDPVIRAVSQGAFSESFQLLGAALRGKDPIFIPLLLAAANACWVAGFDMIYGAQDVAFDREFGIHSIPARFGIKAALHFSSLLHVLAVFFLLLTGWWAPSLGSVYFIGIFIVGLLLIVEHLLVKPDQLEHVKVASYSINEVVGIVFLAFSLLAVYI